MVPEILPQMRADARQIFTAGVEAVDGAMAVQRHCRLDGRKFKVDDVVYDLSAYQHVYVLGA